MLKRIGTLVLGLFLMIGLSSFDSNTAIHGKGWEKLGAKNVNYRLDRDVINVGAYDGTFKKLKLVVTKGNLNMHRMVVHYGNGSKQEIELRHNFGRRSTSRVIDLRGNKRVIKKITFVYDTKNASRRRAKVHVYGRH